MRHPIYHTFAGVIAGLACCQAALSWADDEELARRRSWQPAAAAEVQQAVTDWIREATMDPASREQALDLWTVPGEREFDLWSRTIATFELGDPAAAELVQFCRSTASIGNMPGLDWLDDEEKPELLRHNLRLFVGKWLAMNEMYDEALAMLEPLQPSQVVDPASLLFYRAASYYRLRQQEPGVEALSELLENEDLLPRRYVTVANLMLTDLQALKPDSLDEVARIMDSVRVRLNMGRAGKRVRDEEDEVIAKLEKMIDKLEQQRQQQQQAQSGSGNGSQPSSPAGDSYLPDMQASGDVDPKRLGEEADWGDLPPKEREEALQLLGKEFPSHYREVIEEYFRKLARDEVQANK